MAIADLSLLDAQSLSERLASLAGEERNVQADFLAHLDELDRRRSFAELGYPSLWEYCLRALHLREGAAGRRIGAMRVLRRFPQLDGALRDGRLCLSTLCQLGPVLTDDNVDELTRRAEFMTKAEVEAIVASVKPRQAPADGLRRLPLAAASQAPALGPVRLETSHADTPAQLAPVTPLGLAPASPAPLAVPPSTPREAEGSRPEVRAVSTDQWSLRVTLDPEAKADLEALAALLAHKIPRGDLASVLKVALRCAVETHARRKGALPPARPRAANACSAATASPRAIPAAVRRAVWARDAGCCTFTAPDGIRCASRWKLELDHVVPAALGGPPTADNLRLRCRTHNLLHAEAVFGREHMERCRAGAGRG
ncbi:MAG TPA: HNH endonuclease [Anaeromyxobacteraceae bacterium]|jgi:hypothetical protein|nr:HNH endonuclease [Anaeromyxobacteraceae bacterium]